LALRQQLLSLQASRPRHRLRPIDKLFWLMLRRAWSGWKKSVILVTPETVVRGIELGSDSIGLGFHGPVLTTDGSLCKGNCASWSCAWWQRIRPGELPAFMARHSSWDYESPSGQYLAECGALAETLIRCDGGWRFSATTAMPSQRWTSSQ